MTFITIALFFATLTALFKATTGNTADDGLYTLLFWVSLALTAMSLLLEIRFSGAGHRPAAQNARQANARAGAARQAIAGAGNYAGQGFAWLGRHAAGLGSGALPHLQAFAAWVGKGAMKYKLWLIAAFLGILLAYAGLKHDQEMSFGYVLTLFLLFHALTAVVLAATGVLAETLAFLGRNLLVAWLYLFAWILLFTAVKMDDLGFLWYMTGEVWLVAALAVIGARIIYGNVNPKEWWVIIAIATGFALYFYVTNVEIGMPPENAPWVVAVAFSLFLLGSFFLIWKGVNRMKVFK